MCSAGVCLVGLWSHVKPSLQGSLGNVDISFPSSRLLDRSVCAGPALAATRGTPQNPREEGAGPQEHRTIGK